MAVRFRCYALPLIFGIILLLVPLWEAANTRSRYCFHPPRVNNTIAINVQKVPIGGYVNYTCKHNFYAFGITTAMCIVKNHRKIHWIGPNMICEKMCGKPPDSPRAYPVNSTKDRYPPYMVIEYRCKYGRLTLGSATTVCRNGKWKAASFFCLKQCGRPQPVANTKLITSYPNQKQFREKSTVTYKCNEGYHQTGINLAWCFRGKWHGPYINCSMSLQKRNEICGVPLEIENGQARIIEEPIRHVIYSCADGMRLIGSATVNCQAGGKWDSKPPKCLLKPNFCSKPPSVMDARHNASLERPAFPHGSTLLYSCIPGYFHTGSTIARCNGTTASWKDLTMKCEPMHCSPPGEISGGRIEGSKYTYMSKIFFHCEIGHKLIGQNFRVCQEDGNWDGPMSTCQREECPVLEKPENGGKFGSNKYNDVTKYVCYSGFKLIGDKERRCTENLTWTGLEPKCVPFQCRTLKPPANGYVKAEYSVNRLANYTCDIGFELQGPATRQCREDETWTGMEPQCIEVGCKPPEPLWLGTISGSSYKSGSIIFFSCNYGTTKEGKASSICVKSQWSAETPKCYAKCTIPDIRGLNIFQQKFLNLIKLKPYDTVEHDVNVKYYCEPGYRPSIPKSFWCSNGTWSIDIKCTEDNSTLCEKPLTPYNGYMTYEITPEDPNEIQPGNYAIYSCKPGYSLHGKKRVRCGDNGRWESNTPRCIFFYPGSKKCNNPGTPENGRREVSDISFGLNTTVTFFCNPGFILFGREKITCLKNFMWSYPKPRCVSFVMG